MEGLVQWAEIAKLIGAGGAFVLGVGCWKLWIAYQVELTYSKTRDRETLTVLAAIVNSDKEAMTVYAHGEQKILSAIVNSDRDVKAAISDLRSTILRHDTKTKLKPDDSDIHK